MKFITLSSCSGIRKEHKDWEEDLSGYISFYDDGDEDKKKIIKDMAETFGIEFNEGETYLKPSYSIRVKGTDEFKISIWNECNKYFKIV